MRPIATHSLAAAISFALGGIDPFIALGAEHTRRVAEMNAPEQEGDVSGAETCRPRRDRGAYGGAGPVLSGRRGCSGPLPANIAWRVRMVRP